MKSIFSGMVLIAVMSITFSAPSANAATKNVDCDKGETIGHVLETAKGTADLLEINVSGVCNERLIIRRDHVWITGLDGAIINGTVGVFNAHNIRFFDITITGPGDGLVAGQGDVSGFNLTLAYNEGAGLNLRRNSTGFFRDSHIIGSCENTEDVNCGDGAMVDASTLDLRHSLISNARHGIVAVAGSRVILDDRLGDNSKVFENSIAGIQVDLKSLVDLRGTSHIHDNRTGAMHILAGSHARIASPDVTVEGYIQCDDPLWSNLVNPHYLPVDSSCWWW